VVAPDAPSGSAASSDVTQQLAFLSQAVAVAGSADEIAAAVRVVLRRLLGATSATIGVVRDDQLHLEGDAGTSDELVQRFRVMALTDRYPMADAVVKERPVYLADPLERVKRYPSLTGAESVAAASAVLPLVVGDEVVGALGVTWPFARAFSSADRRTLQRTAQIAARALARVTSGGGGRGAFGRWFRVPEARRRPIGIALGGLALVAVGAIYLLASQPSQLRPVAFLIAAVAAVAFLAGPRVGGVVAALGVVEVWLVGTEPRWSPAVDSGGSVVGLALLVAALAIVIGVVGALDRSAARLERTSVALEESQRLMRLALGGSRLGVAFTTGDGTVLQANESFGTLVGQQHEDLPGTNLATLVEPNDHAALAALLTGDASETDLHLLRPDGAPASGHVSVSLLRPGARLPPQAFFQIEDVTEVRRAQQAERDARQAAEEALLRLERLQAISDDALRRLEMTALLPTVLTRLRDALSADTVGFEPAAGVRVEPVALGREVLEPELSQALEALDEEARHTSRPLVRRGLSLPRELGDLGIAAAVAIRLESGGRVLGVLHVAVPEDAAFGRDELDLVGLAADRIAVAVDRSLRFEQQREVANAVRRSLLPPRLPHLPGIDLVARYWPAGNGEFLGGDFYDVVPSGGTATAIFVGDVCGKGVRAATLTGLARHTLRAAALENLSPDRALHWLDRAVKDTEDPTAFCTSAYVRLEPDGDPGAGLVAEISVGGHPLPVLAHRGSARPVGRPGSLLGPLPDPQVHLERVHIAPGDALIVYTDGLVDMPAEAGLDAERLMGLVAACSSAEGATAASIADAVSTDLEERRALTTRRDDTVLVVLRVTGEGDAVPLQPTGTTLLERTLDYGPQAPGEARRALAAAVEALVPAEDAAETLALLVSEVVTNAVRHGRPPLQLSVALAGERIRISIADGAPTKHLAFPRREPGGAGRRVGGWGLQLVEALATDWGEEWAGDHKVVWFEVDLAERAPAAG
jgi:PAS domain S-box-containing protein